MVIALPRYDGEQCYTIHEAVTCPTLSPVLDVLCQFLTKAQDQESLQHVHRFFSLGSNCWELVIAEQPQLKLSGCSMHNTLQGPLSCSKVGCFTVCVEEKRRERLV